MIKQEGDRPVDFRIKLTLVDIEHHLANGDFAIMNNLMNYLLLCKMINQCLV